MFSSRRKLIKFIKILLFTVICSFFLSLLIALIHTTLIANINVAVLGITLLISSIITLFYNEKLKRDEGKIEPIKHIELIESHRKSVQGDNNRAVQGDNNRAVQGDGNQIVTTTIGRDKNENKNITINNKQVEISSDISQTLGDFKDILNEMMDKSPNPVDVISQFAKELTEELCKQPELKISFNAEEYSSEKELANKIIIDLLTKSYDEISQINQVIQTSITRTDQASQIQKVNNSNVLEYTYYIPNENEYNNDRDNIPYKEYAIYLAKDHENMWHLDIKRENDSSLDLSKQRRFSSKDNAIGTAKKKIDKDRMAIWKTSNINTLE
ncbi:MAG: hypothetical protein WBA07_19460 [Rivularia sp. (in: cyanobacteria)]